MKLALQHGSHSKAVFGIVHVDTQCCNRYLTCSIYYIQYTI